MKLHDLENSIAEKVNNKTQKNIEKKRKSIVINALQYKQNSSGIGVMIRELFSRFVTITPHPSIVILPHDGPEFKTNGKTKIVLANGIKSSGDEVESSRIGLKSTEKMVRMHRGSMHIERENNTYIVNINI